MGGLRRLVSYSSSLEFCPICGVDLIACLCSFVAKTSWDREHAGTSLNKMEERKRGRPWGAEVKRPGSGTEHSPAYSAGLKTREAVGLLLLPHMPSWRSRWKILATPSAALVNSDIEEKSCFCPVLASLGNISFGGTENSQYHITVVKKEMKGAVTALCELDHLTSAAGENSDKSHPVPDAGNSQALQL